MSNDPNVRRYFVANYGKVWGHVDFVRIVEVHDDDLDAFVNMTDRERDAFAANHGKRPIVEQNASIECVECNQVLIDFEREE